MAESVGEDGKVTESGDPARRLLKPIQASSRDCIPSVPNATAPAIASSSSISTPRSCCSTSSPPPWAACAPCKRPPAGRKPGKRSGSSTFFERSARPPISSTPLSWSPSSRNWPRGHPLHRPRRRGTEGPDRRRRFDHRPVADDLGGSGMGRRSRRQAPPPFRRPQAVPARR